MESNVEDIFRMNIRRDACYKRFESKPEEFSSNSNNVIQIEFCSIKEPYHKKQKPRLEYPVSPSSSQARNSDDEWNKLLYTSPRQCNSNEDFSIDPIFQSCLNQHIYR